MLIARWVRPTNNTLVHDAHGDGTTQQRVLQWICDIVGDVTQRPRRRT